MSTTNQVWDPELGHNKSSLGSGVKPVQKTSSSAVERQAVIKAFEVQEEERRVLKRHSLKHFAEWAKWDKCMEQDRDWQRLTHEDDASLFRFEIAATEDQLPTQSLLVV